VRRIWLNAYPPGIPAEIDARRFASLGEMFECSCSSFRDLPALESFGAVISYGVLERLARDFGAFLRKGLSLAPGDRVAIMLPNLLQYPVALFGALRAGLTVVNVNPLYTAPELAQQLADAKPAAIVVLENFAHRLQDALRDAPVPHVITTQTGDLLPGAKRLFYNFTVKRVRRMVPAWRIDGALALRTALRRGARAALERSPVGPGDIAFLQYTGGTSGRPKGAILTHGNMLANVEQTRAWVRRALRDGEETVVTALPLYHAFALTANLLLFVRLGGCNLLIADPRDLRGLVATLARTRFSAITGVNTLFAALLDTPGFERVGAANRGALKVAIAGGMALQRTVAERWQRAMGVPLLEGYGLSEASPIVCANPVDARGFSGKVGLPLPSTEVAILDETGAEALPGEAGEICVRGPQVMRGYWNLPEETAAAFAPGGWLRTGDIGRIDERGYVELLERRKDVIVVSGFKAYPTEIENAALLHPGVKDAGAVGVPDEHSGEAVVLCVVKRDAELTERELHDHCAAHLARYKMPRRILFVDRLPKTTIGKVLRRELRAELAHAHG
jgi:long-chain acyl-CoA synthetase